MSRLIEKSAVSMIDLAVSPSTPSSPARPEARALRDEVLRRLASTVGKDRSSASPRDWFIATALAARDRIVPPWFATTKAIIRQDRRRVYYLSLEFLVGRLLIERSTNLGMTEPMRAALADLGVDLDALRALEPDAALGNGGLGRLAACFMDSMATLEIAGFGYGIRYDHGLFRQAIKDGWQHEYPEDWLSFGNPWEFPRPEIVYDIGFGGHVDGARLPTARWRMSGVPAETVRRSPTTRRWSAGAASTSTLCGCGRRARPIRCGSTPSTPAITSARWPIRCAPNQSPRCSIPATRPRRGRSCGCARSISSPPPRCRI